MTKAHFNNVKLSGITTVIPSGKIILDDEASYYPEASKLAKLKKLVGLATRAVVDDKTTPSDLMYDAALRLINEMNIELSSIDALICVLDFPDYKCPPTACILQGKLNLPQTCLAFDVNHGCAGYVYGLYIASSLIQGGNCRRVLLLVGDTKSRTINIKDRVSAPIFGDGAAATLLDYTETSQDSYFVLGVDGKNFENIMIPAGGSRIPCSNETSVEHMDESGNIRSLNNFYMNGRNVFDFTMREVPQNIRDVLKEADVEIDDIDYFVLHQANKSILQGIACQLGIMDMSKVPTETLAKIGNLAVASIPSTLNDQLSAVLSKSKRKLLLSGFGVGLSYASAIVEVENIYCPSLCIYRER